MCILEAIMQDIPHALSDADFRKLAGRSHGYVGADLAAVCREAGLKCINRCAKEKAQSELPSHAGLLRA